MKSNTPASVLRAMASASSPDSDVSSTTVQVTSIGGQQIFQSGKGQQYLIVNQALQGSGGRIQIVTSDKQESSGETVLGEPGASHPWAWMDILTKAHGGGVGKIRPFFMNSRRAKKFLEKIFSFKGVSG